MKKSLFVFGAAGVAFVAFMALKPSSEGLVPYQGFVHEPSSIDIPVEIDVQALERIIMNEAPKPLSRGDESHDLSIKVTELVPCARCEAGRLSRQRTRRCDVCGGDGRIRDPRPLMNGDVPCPAPNCIRTLIESYTVDCPECTMRRLAGGVERAVVEQNKMIATKEARVEHKAELVDVDLRFDGNKITVVADIDFGFKVSPRSTILKEDQVELNGYLHSGWKGGDKKPRVQLKVEAKVDVRSDASLKIGDIEASHTWVKSPNLTAVSFDSGVSLKDISKLPFITGLINDEIKKALEEETKAGFDLEKEVEKIWAKASGVHEFENDIKLHLDPQAIGITHKLRTSEDHVYLTLRLVAKPVLAQGEMPKVSSPMPRKIEMITEPVSDQFSVLAKIVMDLDMTQQHLLQLFQGSAFTDQGIIIESVQVAGLDHRLHMALQLTQPIQGRIELVGSLSFDEKLGLRPFELDWTVDSENLLVDTAAKSLKGLLIPMIEDHARFDVKGELTRRIPDLDKMLKEWTKDKLAGIIQVDATLDEVKPVAVQHDRTHLTAFFLLQGRAKALI